MPYSRIYLNRKTRKNLERLADKYGTSSRELLEQMADEYYNLMPLLEAEIGDGYSLHKFRQSTNPKLGAFPLVRISWRTQKRLGHEVAKARQSQFRYLTRIVAMGQEELEHDLWRRAAKKQFLAENNLTSKKLKRSEHRLTAFWNFLDNHPNNPDRLPNVSKSGTDE